MRKRVMNGLAAMTVVVLLSACAYTPDQRVWPDINYPQQSVQLQIVDKADMNKEDAEETRRVLTQALSDQRISASSTADRKLVIEVVKYQKHPLILSALQWGAEIGFGVPSAHFTTNAFDLRARLIMRDGLTVEFTKLAEIKESGREFQYLQENMARRVAYAVLTADALAKAHGLGYDKD